MKKVELVDFVADNTALNRLQSAEVVECVFKGLAEALCRGESIYIRGFGTFKTGITKPRKARNISKDITMIIPPRNIAKLILCENIKAKMNEQSWEV